MSALARLVAFATVSFSISSAALAAEPYPNTGNFGVPYTQDEHWYQQCMRVENLGAPEVGKTGGASPQCDAGALYYTKINQAVTSAAEWNKVRACASKNADYAVLMMLYANGFGVQRDTDMAIHYACKLEYIAKAEMKYRIEHLAATPRAGVPFDQCDDITSGYMGAVCAEIRERQDERVRGARLDSVSKALSPAGRDAFGKLRAAAERYVVGAAGEVDMQGTGAPALSLQYQARLREQFMRAALDTVSGKLPSASPADYALRDVALNEIYQSLMTAPSAQSEWPDRIGVSTIDHNAVRGTERLWLAYRDAFVAFAATLPSGPNAVAVKTLLTGQRTAQLTEIERYR